MISLKQRHIRCVILLQCLFLQRVIINVCLFPHFVYINMKQRLNQMHKILRRENKEKYFKQRRIEVLLYRQSREGNNLIQQEVNLGNGNYGWRGIVLQTSLQRQGDHLQRKENKFQRLDLEMKLTSMEEGQYYLNLILQEASIRSLDATIYLLGKLVHRVLGKHSSQGFIQINHQINLLHMILAHTYNLLHANMTGNMAIFRYISNTRSLTGLFADDYKELLRMDDRIITEHLVKITQLVCNIYNISPNFQLIKFLLYRSIKENFEIDRQSASRIQNILMRFVVLWRGEERNCNKLLNIPHEQIIYQLNEYFKRRFQKILMLMEGNQPLDQIIITETLNFTLTLYSQMISRFKASTLAFRGQFYSEEEYLVKEEIVQLLQKIILAHERKQEEKSYHLEEITFTLEQTTSNILWYLFEKSVIKRSKKILSESQKEAFELLTNKDSLSQLTLLIKVKLRQFNR